MHKSNKIYHKYLEENVYYITSYFLAYNRQLNSVQRTWMRSARVLIYYRNHLTRSKCFGPLKKVLCEQNAHLHFFIFIHNAFKFSKSSQFFLKPKAFSVPLFVIKLQTNRTRWMWILRSQMCSGKSHPSIMFAHRGVSLY